MAEVLKVPKISDTISEVTINNWLVKEGDTVKKDQILAQFETDKANFDYESPRTGIILKILASQGQTLKVGDSLIIVGQAGEDYR
ncbi:MAG: biotin/lipoyl-containing protein [Planctomycetota bacterium]